MVNFILGGVSACNPSRFLARSQISKVHSRERVDCGNWKRAHFRLGVSVIDKSLRKLSLICKVTFS